MQHNFEAQQYYVGTTETGEYEVVLKSGEAETSLLTVASFSEALQHAQNLAKVSSGKVFVAKSCVADIYVAVDQVNPKIIRSSTQPEQGDYRFVEGPFLTEQEAQAACFKILGKKAEPLVEDLKG